MKLGMREMLFVVAMLGLLAASYFLVFTKQDAKRSDKVQQRDTKRAALHELDRATASVHDVDKKIKELQAATAFFESKLPQAKEMDKVLKEIWQLADANGLRTQTVKTPRSVKMAGYSEQMLELNLAGDFKGFYEFMLQLEKLPRLTKVTKMNLTKITDKDGEMQASLTMSIYFEPDTGVAVSSAQ
ncbi:type IV pilus inner membrane component PilO [Humisphaera borealis]|uniref:Type 4a pilus biogenesis protein PilO n=1 Tax=Humisphaera borealis TaxID=2807512 RepID=A0A7M2X051_9BACT|nr:type 4a pilus biogenesis protein PilO [Humisphaera borealis]QOV90120.1 type 4a pilus biogenesis protein PilO [Humisphaera borealis]